MRSIRFRLLTGFAVSGLIGACVLAITVVLQYDLLSSSAPSNETARAEILEHVILPLVVFLVLFATGAVLVVRQVETELTETAKEISQAAAELKSYDPDLAEFPNELRPFVRAVSGLTKRLSGHARRQEAFAADAAHELKTPLALLALELDKLSETDAQRFRDHIRSLSDMIDQFLLLSRSNAAEIAGPSFLIDPSSLVRSIVEELAPSAIEAGRELSCQTVNAAFITGLEEAIAAAVRTLVSNAIRATPPGGQIVVVAGPGPMISVLDDGPGLDPTALEHLKARGVRADSAPGGAAGLGLAIADRIAEAHGGKLQTCRPGANGLRLIFPSHLSV